MMIGNGRGDFVDTRPSRHKLNRRGPLPQAILAPDFPANLSFGRSPGPGVRKMKIAASLRAVGVAALAAAAAGGVNACASEADGGGMVVTQNAPTPTVCPMIYLPVCGREATGTWKTYGNDCEAKAAGATAIVPGPCKPSQ